MASPTTVAGDLSVSGELRVTGDISPPKARSVLLTENELKPFAIPLTSFRVATAMQTLLPGAGATPDLGLVGGTYTSATPSLRTEDLKAAGATNNRARVLVQIPWEYIDGHSITIRLKAGMITTISDGTATLDLEAYKLQGDPDDAIGSDHYAGAAQSINSLTFANIDFALTNGIASVVAGDIFDIRITTAVNDSATATAVIAGITSAKLLCDVR